MKHYFFFLLTSALMGGCDHSGDAPKVASKITEFYGEKFDTTGAILQSEMIAKVNGKDTIPVTFTAKIFETCAHAGCWMTVENPVGMPMYVYMKDHAFGVPLSGAAKLNCIVKGYAYQDTISVDMLKHFAEDANKPQAVIDAITAPLLAVAVTANGVMIEGYEEPIGGHDGHDGHDHSHEGHDHKGHDHEGHANEGEKH